MSTVARPALSASEFFEWEAGQLDKHEFYHGDVFSMAGGATDRQSAEGLARDGGRWVLIEPDADRQLPLDALGVSVDVGALYDGMGLSADIPFPEGDRNRPGAGGGR